MKRVDTIARVRRAFYVQGWSVKKIVRELHVTRNTVRKILRTDETDFSCERIANQWPSAQIEALMPWNYSPCTVLACRLPTTRELAPNTCG